MANNIDMWNDIEDLEKEGQLKQAKDLNKCYTARYIEGEEEQAEVLKDKFYNQYNYWDNWY